MKKQSPIIIVSLVVFLSAAAYAAQKQWSGKGDGVSWEDPYNWYPQVAPAASDDILLDTAGASVTVEKTFSIKSLAIGGKEQDINLTKQDFVYGSITPASNTDVALDLKKGGVFTIKNEGDVVLKGKLKSSYQAESTEPSFMFIAE